METGGPRGIWADKASSVSEAGFIYPNFDQTCILQMDASGVALGAMLTQDKERTEHLIAYASNKLLAREQKYSTIECECLTIRWAVDLFHYYLLGWPFILITDSAFRWIQSAKMDNVCITRWALALQPFSFTVQHCPGEKNIIADFLSCKDEEEGPPRLWVRKDQKKNKQPVGAPKGGGGGL